MQQISIIIPAYNEQESIGEIIDGIDEIMSNQEYEILVVDDGSIDNTANIVRERKSTCFRDIKLIQHETNRGYGSAIKTGLRQAKNEFILIIDGDGTYQPCVIPAILSEAPNYDMVVGARTGKIVKIPFIRKPAKWLLNKLANYLTQCKIPDLNSGLRIFKKDLALEYFHILPSGFSFTTTITLAFLSNDYLVKYISIDYHKRTGKSKINPIKDTTRFLLLIIRTIMYFNPLRIFVPLSCMLLSLAIIIFLYSYCFTPKVMDITVIVFILSSIQLLAMGLLADLVDRKGRMRE